MNGKPFVPGYNQETEDHCPSIDIIGATDGSGIQPYLKKTDILQFYQYMLPIAVPTSYRQTLKRGLLDVYEFGMDDIMYVRSNVTGLDCFAKSGNIELPDGLMDSSQIAFGE